MYFRRCSVYPTNHVSCTHLYRTRVARSGPLPYHPSPPPPRKDEVTELHCVPRSKVEARGSDQVGVEEKKLMDTWVSDWRGAFVCCRGWGCKVARLTAASFVVLFLRRARVCASFVLLCVVLYWPFESAPPKLSCSRIRVFPTAPKRLQALPGTYVCSVSFFLPCIVFFLLKCGLCRRAPVAK